MVVARRSSIRDRKLFAGLAAAFLLIFSARGAAAATTSADGVAALQGAPAPVEVLGSDERADDRCQAILPEPAEEAPLDGSICGAALLPTIPARCIGTCVGRTGTGALALTLLACPARGPPADGT